MPDPFSPFAIGRLKLRNRFVRSATWDGTADESGFVTERSVAIYRKLAASGIGLIITGYAFVSENGKAPHRQYGAHSNDMIPSLRRIVEAVHSTDAKVALQIVHSGLHSFYLGPQGIVALAPSRVRRSQRPHRRMTRAEIENVIADFAAAAVRAREVGFDAVQLHGAHSYLMSQFISPLYNHRKDRWGGSPENRRRFHLEVIRRVREAVGADYPIFMKLGVVDDEDGGLSLDEGIEAAYDMVMAGVEALEISAGCTARGRPFPTAKSPSDMEDVYYRPQTAAVKRKVSVPVIMVGGIRSLEQVESILTAGDADLISMCRPFIREPDLILRWERGDTAPAKCISCNRCVVTLRRGEPLECGEERRLQEEKYQGPIALMNQEGSSNQSAYN